MDTILEGTQIQKISLNRFKILVETKNHIIEFIQSDISLCCEEWQAKVIFEEKEFKTEYKQMYEISKLSNQDDLEIISHSFKRPKNTKKLSEEKEDIDIDIDRTIYYIETNRGVIQLIQETFHNGYYPHDHNLYIIDKKGFIIYQNLQSQ